MAEELKADGELQARIEELKTQGNNAFKEGHWARAVERYTEALKLNPESAVLYSNRSLAHLKLENYGFAQQDATRAIEVDPRFIKGYYRRGSALFAIGKFKEAIRDLKAVCNIVPNDKQAQAKLKTAQKEWKAIRFAECLQRDEAQLAVNPEDILVPESYTGPRLPEQVTPEWVLELMEWLRQEKLLHKKYATQILLRIKDLLAQSQSLVYVDIPAEAEFTVCGDVHGQYYDLLNIFQINGNPSPDNPYLFNGDFVDRGSFSVEVILVLFAWKLCFPDHFHLTRGNHETRNMNKMYGFEGEVKEKYDPNTMELFSQVFCYLPLVVVLNRQVMVTHGGLTAQDNVTLADIEAIDRIREPPDSGVFCDLLWSDPCKENGKNPSKRGVSFSFGPDVAHRFLDNNNLSLLVRSHEMKEEGYEVEANGRVITIFSAPNYCDQMGNKGALIRFKGADMRPQFKQFVAVPHPSVAPMKYARPFMFM